MNDTLYRHTLEAARSEMEELLDEQGKLENRLLGISARLSVLNKTIVSVSELLGEDFEPQVVGITDAIRGVMKARSQSHPDAFWSPSSVRTTLQKEKFRLEDYKNPLAVIHTTMKRLADQGELEARTAKDEKTYYRWKKEMQVTDEDIPF